MYNSGTESYLRRLSENIDVILLQETWLSHCTSSIWDNLSTDFTVFHSSAMQHKISNNITLGRPFGGTAVMVRNNLARRCSRISTNNPRVTSVSSVCI